MTYKSIRPTPAELAISVNLDILAERLAYAAFSEPYGARHCKKSIQLTVGQGRANIRALRKQLGFVTLFDNLVTRNLHVIGDVTC